MQCISIVGRNGIRSEVTFRLVYSRHRQLRHPHENGQNLARTGPDLSTKYVRMRLGVMKSFLFDHRLIWQPAILEGDEKDLPVVAIVSAIYSYAQRGTRKDSSIGTRKGRVI